MLNAGLVTNNLIFFHHLIKCTKIAPAYIAYTAYILSFVNNAFILKSVGISLLLKLLFQWGHGLHIHTLNMV